VTFGHGRDLCRRVMYFNAGIPMLAVRRDGIHTTMLALLATVTVPNDPTENMTYILFDEQDQGNFNLLLKVLTRRSARPAPTSCWWRSM
jgi:hypothetical protein